MLYWRAGNTDLAQMPPRLAPNATTATESDSLEQRLLNFDKSVIRKSYPDTDESQRLLRPDMLRFLIKEMPVDLDEFKELIPGYLRTHTSSDEANDFLGDVIEIIAVYEELESA